MVLIRSYIIGIPWKKTARNDMKADPGCKFIEGCFQREVSLSSLAKFSLFKI